MRKIKTLLGASLLAATIAMPAHADFVLDTFDYDLNLSANNVGDTASFDVTYPNPSAPIVEILAQYTLENVSASDNPFGVSSLAQAGDGTLYFNEGSAQDGTLKIEYTGSVFGNPFPLDFTQGGIYTNLAVDISYIDEDFSLDLTLNDGTNSATINYIVPSTLADSGVGTYFIALQSFANLGVDITAITSTVAEISSDGDQAGVFIDEIALVPEPGTLAVFGLGLLGLAGAARRRNA